jgi:hypothetical protein
VAQGRVGRHDPLFAMQMLGKRLAARLSGFALVLIRVLLDDRLGLRLGFGTRRLELGVVLKRKPALIGVGKHAPLAAMPIQHVLDQRAELVLFGGECLKLSSLRLNRCALSVDDRPAACKIAGQFSAAGNTRLFAHDEHDNVYSLDAQDVLYANLPEFLKLLLDRPRHTQVPVWAGSRDASVRW